MRFLVTGLFGLALLTAPAMASGKGQIRVINSTGSALTKVTIRACASNKVVAKLKRGEKVDPYEVRFWPLDPGCYVVQGPNNSHRVNLETDRQFDAPLK